MQLNGLEPGQQPTVIATNQGWTSYILNDATSLYWTTDVVTTSKVVSMTPK